MTKKDWMSFVFILILGFGLIFVMKMHDVAIAAAIFNIFISVGLCCAIYENYTQGKKLTALLCLVMMIILLAVALDALSIINLEGMGFSKPNYRRFYFLKYFQNL